MTNPAQQAASIVRASPGTMAVAFLGLTVALLGVESAKFAAMKVKGGLMTVRNNVAPQAQTGPAAGTDGGWS